MSVLVVSKILRPFVNTLTPDDKYALDNSEILKKLIQIGLSNKPKIFSPFFAAVLKSPFNFQHFKKKRWASELLHFPNYARRKTCLSKCLKIHKSVHPRIVNMLKHPSHCWNLHDSSFIAFACHSERTSVRKCLC